MLKIRNLILALGVMMSPLAASAAQVSIGVAVPGLSIGINLPAYPRLVRVPGYPVYYAPRLEANFFFYDGMYWVYQNDDWYASSWYNGPWGLVDSYDVPVFILQIPVSYYRRPPAYFHGWRPDAPPRWGDHWGRDWEQRRSDWDRRPSRVPAVAPLPAYQKQYSGERYPQKVEQQHELQQQKYRYQPRDPVVRQHFQAQPVQTAPASQQREMQSMPQKRDTGPRDNHRPEPAAADQQRTPSATHTQAPQKREPPIRQQEQSQQPRQHEQTPQPQQSQQPRQHEPQPQSQSQEPGRRGNGAAQEAGQRGKGASQESGQRGRGAAQEQGRGQGSGHGRDREKAGDQGQNRER